MFFLTTQGGMQVGANSLGEGNVLVSPIGTQIGESPVSGGGGLVSMIINFERTLLGGGQSVSITESASPIAGTYLTSGGGQISQEGVVSRNVNFRADAEVFSTSSQDPLSTASGSGSGQIIFYSSSSISSSQSFSPAAPFTSVTSAIPGLWLDSSKRRSRSQIYVEILELMKRGPMTPFEIAFYARLNHKRTKEYVEFLKRSGYLEPIEEDGRLTYVLSKNGIVFLEKVRDLFENPQTTGYVNFEGVR